MLSEEVLKLGFAVVLVMDVETRDNGWGRRRSFWKGCGEGEERD